VRPILFNNFANRRWKHVELLRAVTFRASLEGRSTRSVGRESLGLKRSVRVQAFTCPRSLRMNTSRQENGEMVSNRQVGYGLVFGVPKSLSIYLAITGDIRWLRELRGWPSMKRWRRWNPRCSARSAREACREIVERARCCIQSSSTAIPDRLTG
jgi:hypothetical protein